MELSELKENVVQLPDDDLYALHYFINEKIRKLDRREHLMNVHNFINQCNKIIDIRTGFRHVYGVSFTHNSIKHIGLYQVKHVETIGKSRDMLRINLTRIDRDRTNLSSTVMISLDNAHKQSWATNIDRGVKNYQTYITVNPENIDEDVAEMRERMRTRANANPTFFTRDYIKKVYQSLNMLSAAKDELIMCSNDIYYEYSPIV